MTPNAEGQRELSEEDIQRLRTSLAGLAGKSEIWQLARNVQARRRPEPLEPDPDREPPPEPIIICVSGCG
jgi:hypothetical protein